MRFSGLARYLDHECHCATMRKFSEGSACCCARASTSWQNQRTNRAACPESNARRSSLMCQRRYVPPKSDGLSTSTAEIKQTGPIAGPLCRHILGNRTVQLAMAEVVVVQQLRSAQPLLIPSNTGQDAAKCSVLDASMSTHYRPTPGFGLSRAGQMCGLLRRLSVRSTLTDKQPRHCQMAYQACGLTRQAVPS